MPVFAGDRGIPNLTVIDRPYLKPTQTIQVSIKNYQARAGATGTYRLSEISFWGNDPSACSDTDKICNPNIKILGLKLAVDSANNTNIYLVLADYFDNKPEQNALLESVNIPAGTDLKFIIQLGGGKIMIKRGDKVLISTSYSKNDPIINAVYYRSAEASDINWNNISWGGISTYLPKELWNIEYGTMGFGFDIGKLISSVFPLVIIGSLIPALIGARKGKG